MRAITMTDTGGPEVLRAVDAPPPAPGPGEVLVRTHATGVNFIEIYKQRGIVVVASAGNLGIDPADQRPGNGGITSPANGSRIIAVGAIAMAVLARRRDQAEHSPEETAAI